MRLTPIDKNSVIVRIAVLSVGIISMAGMAATAHASDSSRLSSTVKIQQSDLETQDGVVKVYKKLTGRAVKACKNRNRKTTDRVKATAICETHILNDFIKGIDHPDLTAYHQTMQE